MTCCGSTEGIDNSLGCGPQGRAGRHSAVLTLHSHITECLALSPAFLHSPRPRTTTTTTTAATTTRAPQTPPPTPSLHNDITARPSSSPLSESLFCPLSLVQQSISPSYPAIFLSDGAEPTMLHCAVNPL